MRTYTAKPETVQRDRFVVDAAGQIPGRLATGIACCLRGKHKPEYTPHVDTGDYIVVISAEQVHVTGAKTTDKIYHHHSGLSGGIKSINLEKLIIKVLERVTETVVKGMLPKNPLGCDMYRKPKACKGASYPHTAQQPQELKI